MFKLKMLEAIASNNLIKTEWSKLIIKKKQINSIT